ncbi:MAG TPA: suppressor of fused domain protein [Gemmataceae bacterium]|nr:suppressor of fused domain protein [Gemmataceae bacterium]
MPEAIQCSQCGKRYKMKPQLVGKRVTCKACGHAFLVEGPGIVPDLDPAELAEPERSASGSPVYRHETRTKEFTPAAGDSENIEAISDHIETHIGKVAGVFHEIVSDLVHIDVHVVEPTDDRPYHTLVTSGMSDLPMTVPEGAEDWRFAELVISLPPDWPLTQEAFQDERNYWPVRWLKMLARLPHEYDTWLGWGHTVPNGDPPRPFAANTKLCCALLLTPMLTPEEFWQLRTDDDRTINFYALVPTYHEEMAFKLKNGVEALLERFGEEGVTELLDVKRTNVCKGGR